MSTKRVSAAGGVILRQSENGTPEICLVHRPEYDDWTFPKGRLEEGESNEQAALREVFEEAGIEARIRPLIAEKANYIDAQGKTKTVTYFLMICVNQDFLPNSEVDTHQWLNPELAHAKLTFDRDREILAAMMVHTAE